METTTVRVGDIGTLIEIDLTTDVSSAISRVIRARKPYGDTVEWPAVAGSSGEIISYTTQAGDIDRIGRWALQAVVELPAGEWASERVYIDVYPVIQP